MNGPRSGPLAYVQFNGQDSYFVRSSVIVEIAGVITRSAIAVDRLSK